MKNYATIFFLLLCISTFSLALDKGEPPPQQASQPFELKFKISKQYPTPGDTVWFILSLINHSQDTLRFNLPTPQVARFSVLRDDRPVWLSDYGMMFAQVITPLIVIPGDSIPLKAFWLGKNNEAIWVPLGKYHIEACFNGTKQCLRDSLWLVD